MTLLILKVGKRFPRMNSIHVSALRAAALAWAQIDLAQLHHNAAYKWFLIGKVPSVAAMPCDYVSRSIFFWPWTTPVIHHCPPLYTLRIVAFFDILHWLVLGSEPGQSLCFNCVSFVTVSLCLLPVVPVAQPCPIWKRSRPIWWLMAPANVASSVLSSSTRCCQSVSLFVLLICVFLVRFGNTQHSFRFSKLCSVNLTLILVSQIYLWTTAKQLLYIFPSRHGEYL